MHAKRPLPSPDPPSHYLVNLFKVLVIFKVTFSQESEHVLILGCGIRTGMNGAKPSWLEGCVEAFPMLPYMFCFSVAVANLPHNCFCM